MAIVPKPLAERVQFFATHLETFTANASAMGSSPEDVALLQAKVAAAQEAQAAQVSAQSAAEAATQAYHTAVAEMSAQGANIIAQVRTKAKTTGDRQIYHLALLPPPAEKSPIGPPGTPTDLRWSIDGIGQLTLTWKCNNPRGAEGTMYEIRRTTKTEDLSDDDFEFLGVVGTKRFVDQTIPAGATALGYRIRAIRSTKRGHQADFGVSFGSNGALPLQKMQFKQAA